MRHAFIILIAISTAGCNGQHASIASSNFEVPQKRTQLSTEALKALDSLDIDFQLRGGCYAYSSDKNAQASNGEAHSGNLPRQAGKDFPTKGFYLVINQSEFIALDSALLGCKLYLVNTSDSVMSLEASDSRLYIVAEALNKKNEWAPITYFPSSFCGNSYHQVVLDKNEYWEFKIPVFKGEFKTKLRYTLEMKDGNAIHSNEIVALINEGQFSLERKQGHKPNNIMDPYGD